MAFHFRNDPLGDGPLMRQVSFVWGHFPCQVLLVSLGWGFPWGRTYYSGFRIKSIYLIEKGL